MARMVLEPSVSICEGIKPMHVLKEVFECGSSDTTGDGL
jgi:hypothetical protein